MSNKFLSGENTNLVVDQIVGSLTKYGVDIDIKGLQSKIINFMAKVQKEYPNQNLANLNNFVIEKCIEKYLNNRPQFNQNQQKSNLDSQFEREMMLRGYTRGQAPEIPQRPDFTQPLGASYMPSANPTPIPINNVMSLNQARGNPEIPDLEAPPVPLIEQPVINPHHNKIKYSNDTTEELLLSLNKNDLINITNNTFTFSWNRKIIPDFKNNFQMKLEYVTIPKRLPYLLVKYNEHDQSDTKKVYSATGKHYNDKLIPCHTSDEYTTYQALGHHAVKHENLPHTLSFQLIPPKDSLDLNTIQVHKITKNNSQINIITKYPHNLTSNDTLILEFPTQHTCYKVSNLQILNATQIMIDSPFVGYFSSDFKLLRNEWNIDLTVCCQYEKQ